MVLVALILVFSSISYLETWELVGHSEFDLLESWGVARLKREIPIEKIKGKFPDHPMMSCDKMHKTLETPFTAIILYKTSGRFLCMGSIIDHSHILTAKRCYDRTDVDDVLVLAGYYRAYWGRHSQVATVKKIVRHETEIAILRLTGPLKFTDYIQSARLPTSLTKKEPNANKIFKPPYKVIGFNVDRFDVPGDFIDKDLIYKMKDDYFIPFDDCKKNYSTLNIEETKFFCCKGNATFCWGAWGAPVLKRMPSSFYLQIGVVVADNCTADTTGPFLIARTDTFADWIKGNSFHGHQV